MLNYLLDQQEVSWSGQFKKALILGPSLDSEEGDIDEIDGEEAFFHFWGMGWKLLFATIPPPKYCNGWAAFTGSLIWIGIVTLVVGEFANLIGCCFMIPQSVTAITIVALGTSLPDTFASVTAARQSKHADSAVGNITGSNSVNVFLGLGLPWTVACIYYLVTEGNDYKVPSDTLGFSVLLFVICSIFCFILLFVRR
jgi:solute carrier family 8 (sodium/calcium exchanger)